MQDIQQQIEDLKKQIRYHDYQYYCLDNPQISDFDYDNLFTKLKKLEQQYPQFITKDSPTQRVSGLPSSTFNQVKHVVPMLSLDNSYSTEDVLLWYERIKKSVDEQIEFIVEPKIDGLSASLIYKNNSFTTGATTAPFAPISSTSISYVLPSTVIRYLLIFILLIDIYDKKFRYLR